MHPLAKRMRQIMQARGISGREWSVAAGLNPTHVTTTLRRLAENESARVELDTLVKLADAAAVSLPWLHQGEGPMNVDEAALQARLTPPPALRLVSTPDRYPNRTTAIDVARGIFEQETLDAVVNMPLQTVRAYAARNATDADVEQLRNERLKSKEDPTVEEWHRALVEVARERMKLRAAAARAAPSIEDVAAEYERVRTPPQLPPAKR